MSSINQNFQQTSSSLQIVKKVDTFHYKFHSRLVISTTNGKTILLFSEISHIRSDGNYCEVYTIEKERYLVAKTLKKLTFQLNHTFARVHQSYLVNLLDIRHYAQKNAQLHLISGAIIPVARSRKAEINALLK